MTIRERDSMAQERVALDQVEAYLGGAPRRLLTDVTGAAVTESGGGGPVGHATMAP